MTEQEEKELRDEIFHKEMMESELRKLSSEDLIHVDNIITGINKLRENRSVSSSMWALLFMWILGIPMSGFNGTLISNNTEENETDKANI